MASAKGIRAGRAYVELGVSDQLTAGLKAAQKKLESFGKAVQSAGLNITAFGAGIVAPIFASAKVFGDVGDQLDEMSQRTGFSVEALSELGHAATLSGADLETLQAAILRMHKASAAGLLGPAMAKLNPEEQFAAVADALAKITDPGQRAATAMKVFGRNGAMLLPMLKDGSKGLEIMRKHARDMGFTMSAEDAAAAAVLNDALDNLTKSLKFVAIAIGSAVAPLLSDFAAASATALGGVISWIKENRGLVVTALKVGLAIMAVGAAFVAAGTAAIVLGQVIGSLLAVGAAISAAFGALAAILGVLVSPIGLVIAALGVLAVATGAAADAGAAALSWLGDTWSWLQTRVGEVIGVIVAAIKAGEIQKALDVVGAGLKLTWVKVINYLLEKWGTFKTDIGNVMDVLVADLKSAWAWLGNVVTRVWAHTLGWLRTKFAEFSGWFRSLMLDLESYLDDRIDPASLKMAKESVDAETKAAVAQIEQEKAAALAKESEEYEKKKKEIRDKEVASIIKRQAELQKNLDEMTAEELAAQKKLEEAMKAAREAAGAKGANAPERDKRKPALSLANLASQITDAGAGLAARIGAVGTFSGAAAGRIGYGSDALDRTAHAAEETARNTKKLAQKADQGKLIFE